MMPPLPLAGEGWGEGAGPCVLLHPIRCFMPRFTRLHPGMEKPGDAGLSCRSMGRDASVRQNPQKQ